MGMLPSTRIAFVGGGTMGEAFIRGLLNKGLVSPENLAVSDPLETRRAYLSRELGIRTTPSNAEAVADAQIVVLAVKPQALHAVLTDLAGRIDPEALILTIVAGAKIDLICESLDAESVVRIMPNMPGQIGEGISVWTASPVTSESRREEAGAIISALGEGVYVDDERYLDMATAVSGSGPAYVFLFIEALTDAGVRLGLSRPIAEKLALHTVRGAAILASERGLHPAILRNMVTSPGGTTAEALHELEMGGFRGLLSEAVAAAYERAISLGDSDSR
jgi:pyrroline-5-carboxylate reductase